MSYLDEANRIVSDRETRNDHAELERLELIEIIGRLDALAERTSEEDFRYLWVWARMLETQVLKRCPHDPDEYEVIKIDRWEWEHPAYVSAEVRCPHCNAKGGVNDPAIVHRLERRTVNA